ncbi:MAG TPA: histidine kinase [Candidatus Binatia bacterium]|nr:histidine kinase [Candidatus Binatia bacterium]
MASPRLVEIERNLARCRVFLSLSALIAVYIDPTRPTLTRWLPLTGGLFALDPFALTVMLSHFVYSMAVYLAVERRPAASHRIAVASTWADVLFGAAIALVTEGENSPFYVFFAFAVLAAGFRAGLRLTMTVTAASVVLYLGLILGSRPEGLSFYVVRPAYLGIIGYLVGYLGEQRLVFESRIRALEAAAQRERIARSLHDGYAQAFAGVNLRLGSCRELLRRGHGDEALAELADLQAGINREHDELRAYIRSLADVEAARVDAAARGATRFAVRIRFDGSLPLVEHALLIMLEGARNVGRHAGAASATIAVAAHRGKVRITIDDDGVGFPPGAQPPWSIASRASELRGEVRLGGGAGGHVEVELRET